jgi:ribosome-associated translation inhibitor RaiA
MDQIHNVNNIEELRDRLKMLEQQRRDEWQAIKDRVTHQYDRFKPSNLIQNALSSVSETLQKDGDIINEGAALASGLVVNAIMSKSKNKELKKWVNLVVFSLVTYFVTKHREDILEAGEKIVDKISTRLKKMKEKKAERKRQKEAEEEQGED